ncbi:hypothetical protein FDP41_009797 [Naegleria fowleri]|uniref:Uncharacterized protein n=1 Tax=Naegleria fowleri TaxID=5763 RepID=A0A6A5BBB0_NAEFO|nr:uncharacterized protein FDP41_009797 [Naegleria fowleri]KAF0972101.1 hypothetical protein FDP41_009797 [Naegleria fowleri]
MQANNRSTLFILLSLTVISLVCGFLASSSKANTLSNVLSTVDALTLSASSEGYVLSDEASTSTIALSFDEFNEMADEEIFGEDLNESDQNSKEEENNEEEEENDESESNLEMAESGGTAEAQVASADTQTAQVTQATTTTTIAATTQNEDEAAASWLA